PTNERRHVRRVPDAPGQLLLKRRMRAPRLTQRVALTLHARRLSLPDGPLMPDDLDIIELDINDWSTLPAEPVRPPTRAPDLLPFGERGPDAFERECLVVARHAVGLNRPRLYGVAGQSQHGIDLVGVNVRDEVEAWQMKRYVTFTAKDLEKA